MFQLKYRLGLIPSAKKIDAEWAELLKMQDELNALENSKEVKRCAELNAIVTSYDFQIQKKDIQNQSYSGSPECQLINELDQLGKSKSIREYFKLLKSDQLPRFQKAQNNRELSRYNELKKKIDSGEIPRDRKNTDYKEYKQLSKNNEIRFFNKFRDSFSYTNYINTKSSFELERFEELKKITSEPEFIKKVAWLKNKNRYAETDLFKQEEELKSLENSQSMKKYRKLKAAPQLDFFKEWSVVFEDNFGKNVLDKSKWLPENYWGHKTMGKSFSQANEAQGYNGEKNISVESNTLSILVKRERLKGRSWNVETGLIPKEFEYSSGIINSAESFRFSEGIVEAKVKFLAEDSLTNAFSLTGSKPVPQIDIFRSGKKCVGLGYTEMSAGGAVRKYKQIHGLDFNNYHVFSLEKKDHTLVWKINGVQVHQEFYRGPEESLFLNFISSLHEPVKSHVIPHRFQIDWVRCYAKN
jgi:hypothetical protein